MSDPNRPEWRFCLDGFEVNGETEPSVKSGNVLAAGKRRRI